LAIPWNVSLFAADDLDRRHWHKKPFSVVALYVFLFVLSYLQMRVPSPGVAVLWMGAAATLMTVFGELNGKEKIAWTLLLFGFLSLELTSIDRERDASEGVRQLTIWREALHFKDVGTSIKESNDEARRRDEITSGKLMALTVVDRKILVNLRPTGNDLAQQLHAMQPPALIDTAHAVAKEMRVYEQRYKYEDDEQSLWNYEAAHSHLLDDQGRRRVIAEGLAKRNKLRLGAEASARNLIAQANAVRAEIIGRLIPLEPNSARDKEERDWFEDPTPFASGSPVNSLLYVLNPHAEYLDVLANRLAEQKRVPGT
jgi:hypothetical protein